MYSLRFLPHNLGCQSLEWFMLLALGSIFIDLSKKFITNFLCNVEHEITLLDLCNDNQHNRERFTTLLEKLMNIASRFPWPIPEINYSYFGHKH